MPYISIECGALASRQKAELIRQLTATAAGITHIPAEFFTVTIKELPDENFGIGGKSIDILKAEYGQAHSVEDEKSENERPLL